MTFEWLRPEALWLLPLGLLLTYRLWKPASASGDWSRLLPDTFLEALAGSPPASTRSQGRRLLWAIVLIGGPLAIAGPSLGPEEAPLQARDDNLVIVLDLSLSMLATDQSPNRLTRARLKITDLLNRRPEGQTALIAYAGTAHVVTPLTSDDATVRALLPALDPLMMPVLGSRVQSALSRAEALLDQAQASRGRILLITDGITGPEAEAIAQSRDSARFPLSILALGTAEGSPVPIPERGFLRDQGEVVVARTDFAPLQQAAAGADDRYAALSLNDVDLDRLLPEALAPTLQGQRDDGGTLTRPRDDGYWLLLPVIASLVLLGWQRGGFLVLLLLCLPTLPSTARAETWTDWFKRPDHLAWERYRDGQYAQAASRFEDPQWLAAARYRAGDHAGAAAALEGIDTPEAHYNRGNALALAGQLEAAIAAYDRAIEGRPDFPSAVENRRRVLEQLQQQRPESESTSQPSSPPSPKSEDSATSSPSDATDSGDAKGSADSTESSGSTDSEDSAASEADTAVPQPSTTEGGEERPPAQAEPDSGNHPDSPTPTQAQTSPDSPTPTQAQTSPDSTPPTPENALAGQDSDTPEDLKEQAVQQWLRRIPDDPGGLLRRKFQQQAQDDPDRTLPGGPLW